MKKTLSLITMLCFCFSIVLCGCDNKIIPNQLSVEEIYINAINEKIEQGDYEAALDIVEEGIEKTKSEKLVELKKVIENMASFNIADYFTGNGYEKDTYWSTSDISRQTKGYILEIFTLDDENVIYFDFLFHDAADDAGQDETSGMAYMSIDKSKIRGNTVKLSFENDKHGHSGDVKFLFEKDKITFEINNVKFNGNGDNVGGFCNDKGELIKNPNAHDNIRKESEKNEKSFNIADYSDITWRTGGDGGYSLFITLNEASDTAEFEFGCASSAPPYRNADTTMKCAISNITNNEVILYFDDDSWGDTSGKIKLTFGKDSIDFTVSDVIQDNNAMWGIFEGSGTLHK